MPPLLITPTSIALRKGWRWGYSIQNILRAVQPYPFQSGHLIFGSDYGGTHKKSKYHAYCFLIADATPSSWTVERIKIRTNYLKDGRRMSFKRLDDPLRQQALIPFLQAANRLNGHLVCVLVDKKFRYMTSGKGMLKKYRKSLGLSARWNDKSFENMARKAHFFSLCVAQWSRPGSDITWITDEDEFVANDLRLDDAQKFAARLSSLYSDHSFGTFAMNTTAIDGNDRGFEDFVAIPDLAAGMLSEVCSLLSPTKDWVDHEKYPLLHDMSQKADIIMDWFWCPTPHLKRTCIVIDKFESKTRVMKLDQMH